MNLIERTMNERVCISIAIDGYIIIYLNKKIMMNNSRE